MAEIEDKDRRCALYVRVSTLNQAEDGESLDEQVETLEKYCSFKNWQIHGIYREEGVSGKDLKRPAFQRMLSEVEKGKINTVIVKKLDRLSRSIVDFEGLYNFFQDKAVDLVSTQENFDTSTALGRTVIRIVLVFAQLEREQTSERTRDIMAHRARQGLYNGGYPALGYDNAPDQQGLVVCEAEVPVVREVFNTYLKYGSLSETAKILNRKGYRLKEWTTARGKKRGGEPFQKTNLSRMLNNQLYVGKIKYKDEVYDGQHTPIIDQDIYDAVQAMLNANSVSKTGYRQGKYTFYLKGLVRCGHCQTAMAPSSANSKGKIYYYYRCVSDNDCSKEKCKIGSISAPKLEKLVIDELNSLTADPRIINGIVGDATKDQRKKIVELEKKKKTAQADADKVTKKIKNLVELLADGQPGSRAASILTTLEELEARARQLRDEIEAVGHEVGEIETRIVSADAIRENLGMFCEVFGHLTEDERYDLLHLLVKKVVYSVEAKESGGKLKGKIKMDLWELPPIDPSDLNSAKSFAESNVWLPSADSNHGHGD